MKKCSEELERKGWNILIILEGGLVARTLENALKKAHPELPGEYFPDKPGKGEGFKEEHPGMIVDSSPEAQVINATGLIANAGITLDWRLLSPLLPIPRKS